MAETKTLHLWNAWRIEDAAGHRVAPINPLMHRLRPDGAIAPDVLRDGAEEVRIGLGRWPRWGRWLFPVCILGIVMSGIARPIAERSSWALWYSLSIGLPGAVVCTIYWLINRAFRLHLFKQALLKYPRCPHCGYDIRVLPADAAHGATACPECGEAT